MISPRTSTSASSIKERHGQHLFVYLRDISLSLQGQAECTVACHNTIRCWLLRI
jgi:hypothetical protein